MTDIIEFAETVKKMRDAQKEYFRTKSGIALNESKKLEKKVDEMILQVGIPSRSSQKNLF